MNTPAAHTFHAGSMAAETVEIPADSRPVRYAYDLTGQTLHAEIGRTRDERLARATDRREARLSSLAASRAARGTVPTAARTF